MVMHGECGVGFCTTYVVEGGGVQGQRLLGAGLVLRAGAVGVAADGRRGRHGVDGEGDVAAELAVAAEGVELRRVDAGLRRRVALAVPAGDGDAVLVPLDAGGA